MTLLYVTLFTYSRAKKDERSSYAEKTLRSALDMIQWPEPYSVHIADDGSWPGHVKQLEDIARGYANVANVTSSNAQRHGYGASFNLSTQTVHGHDARYVLPLEDDWVLADPLDLAPIAQALDTGDVGCVRLGYIGFTNPLKGVIRELAGQKYLIFDPASEERHVFAGHPRLELVEWEKYVGAWPEGLDAGTTEFEVAGRPESRYGVAWPLDMHVRFQHIGAVQAREDQLAATA